MSAYPLGYLIFIVVAVIQIVLDENNVFGFRLSRLRRRKGNKSLGPGGLI